MITFAFTNCPLRPQFDDKVAVPMPKSKRKTGGLGGFFENQLAWVQKKGPKPYASSL
jgi:hypothetical protein